MMIILVFLYVLSILITGLIIKFGADYCGLFPDDDLFLSVASLFFPVFYFNLLFFLIVILTSKSITSIYNILIGSHREKYVPKY